MGGKTGTTTQQSSVSIPPEVMARYNSVNARAEKTADQQFTPYSGEFVAPLTGTQQAGISNINQAQGMATPYYDAAGGAMNTGYQMGSGLALASAGQVNPEALTGQNINQYMSPYVDSVVASTMANLRQQQGEEQSKILGNQITSGAFGGDRGRIAQANLARQQGLATGQTVSSLMNQGYGQALQTAQQQQAQQLAASQANRAALAGAGQSLYSMGQGYGQGIAGLGTQSFDTALKGAQAQIGAGTLEQQTQQAQNTADYNQFLQQQGYPFQIAQFLANIAMGTGALSGSSQEGTTKSPQSFFSDRRLKDDIEKIGKTFDGQDIVRYKYKGEPGTRIGLIAQDVEKHHPDAVGLAGGYRTVDYDKATDDAAKRGHFADGGLAGGYSSEGGAVMPEMAGMGFAAGGAPDINSMMAEILNSHQGMYPYGKAGMYGQTSGRAGAYGTSQMQTPTRGLMRVDPSAFVRASEAPSAGGQAMQGLNAVERVGSAYTSGSNALFGSAPTASNPQGSAGLIGRGGEFSLAKSGPANFINRLTGPSEADKPFTQAEIAREPVEDLSAGLAGPEEMATGGLARGHYAMGGLPFSEAGGYIPEGVLNDNQAEKNKKAMDSFAPKSPGSGQSNSGSGSGLMGGLGQIGGAINGIKNIGSLGSSLGSLFGGAGEAAVGAGEAAAGATAAAEAASAANIAAGSAEGFGSLLAMLPMMAASDRRLKDDIEKIGKTFDGQDIVRYRYKGEPATQIGLIAQDVEKHHPNAVGMAGGYRTVDYRKATEDAAKRGHFAGGGLAGMRHGYAVDGEVVDEVIEPKQIGLSIVDNLDPEVERIRRGFSGVESGGRYNAVGRDVVRPGRETDRAYGRYQVMGENVGPWTEAAFGQRMSPNEFLNSPKAQDAVVRNQIQQNLNRYGNADDVASVWFSGRPVAQAGQSRDANNVSVPEYLRRFRSFYNAPAGEGDTAPAGSTGLRVPVSSDATGLGAAQLKDNTGDGGSDQGRPIDFQSRVARALEPETREAPNWMQRNQDWLVPLLSGVGAMASSPSRYLGAALLQGIGGGAQQYAAMQQRGEEQQRAREQLGVSRANTLVAQQREQVAEQQLREQMIQRILQQFGDQLSNGMWRNPFNGQLVSTQQRMQIATQMASGSGSTGVPARAPAGEAGAVPPAAGGTGTAPPAAREAGTAPPSTGGTGTIPPAAAPGAEAPAAGARPPANDRQLPRFIPMQDPDNLRRLAAEARLVPNETSQREAVRLETLATDIQHGRVLPQTVDGPLYHGFREAEQEQERQQALLRQGGERTLAITQDRIKNVGEQAQTYLGQTYPEAHELLGNMASLRQAVMTNRGSDVLANLTGLGSQLPWIGEWIDRNGGALQAAFDAGNKEAIQQAFRTLADSAATRAPATGLREAILTVANPTVSPTAAYMMITNAMGRNEQQNAYYQAWVDRGQPDPLSFSHTWHRENPLSGFVQRAVDQTGYFAGMSDEARRVLPVKRSDDPIRRLPDGQTGQGSNLIRVNTPEEALRLPSGTRFIDPSGTERTRP